ncbi:MAG: DegT/DnrJ/EryC1/StrS family aminotransferase [Gaiellaceae bacterium]
MTIVRADGRLALAGGPAARSRPDGDPPLAVGADQIGDEDVTAVEALLRGKMLYRYRGSAVEHFERSFEAWLDAGSRALAVSSGSAALQLALAAVDLEPGAEVIVPTVGFVSIATAVHAAGAVPRFAPVGEALCVDPDRALATAGDRTGAIVAVHSYGSSADLDALSTIAERHEACVVEDVAQACGGSFRGRRLGTFGRAAAFSFQHFKLATTGEGGMVVTSEADAYARAAVAHDAAAKWNIPALARQVRSLPFPPGNLRMSELEAALGAVQIARCDSLISRLRAIKAALVPHVDVSGITTRPHADPAGDIGSHMIFYAETYEEADWAARALRAEGVCAASLLGGSSGNRHWAGEWGSVLESFGAPPPDADVLAADEGVLRRGVTVAIDPRMDDRDVAETQAALDKVFAG